MPLRQVRKPRLGEARGLGFCLPHAFLCLFYINGNGFKENVKQWVFYPDFNTAKLNRLETV